MPEDIDFSKAIEELKNMLSSSEGESQIQNILGMIKGTEVSGPLAQSIEETAKEPEENSENILSGLGDIQNILKLKNILGAAEGQKDNSGAAFLYALKPFLSESRQTKLENAAKILNVTKAVRMLKDLGLGGV